MFKDERNQYDPGGQGMHPLNRLKRAFEKFKKTQKSVTRYNGRKSTIQPNKFHKHTINKKSSKFMRKIVKKKTPKDTNINLT